MQFTFPTSNNEAKDEALVQGLRLAQSLPASRIKVSYDTRLVVEQVLGSYEGERMVQHLALIRDLSSRFEFFDIAQIPREENGLADALTGIALSVSLRACHIELGVLHFPSIGT